MRIIRFDKDDVLVMKKPHPCGETRFRVQKAGSEARVVCLGCGRDMLLPRLKLEKNVKTVLPHEPNPGD